MNFAHSVCPHAQKQTVTEMNRERADEGGDIRPVTACRVSGIIRGAKSSARCFILVPAPDGTSVSRF